jgi:ABC-2 type transport system ATP-binding protein
MDNQLENAIEVDRLGKSYGAMEAVRGISFGVATGEIFGFLGPNGAGKTTTIKMLATLLAPSGGRASIAGFDVAREPLRVRESIGLVFQDGSLDDRLTAEENLYIHALLYDVPRAEVPRRLEEALRRVDLLDRRTHLVRTFSGGMKRRLEIARGLMHAPKVLFLDEPTAGLDPQTRRALWDQVRRLRDEHRVSVFMTTHYLDEAEYCDRIAIIDHGVIVALGTPEELKRQVGSDVIIVGTKDKPALAAEISRRYGVKAEVAEDGVHFQVETGASFIPRLIADIPGTIDSVSVHRPTLDDVFLQLTGRAIREDEATAKDALRTQLRVFRGRR